MKDNSLYILAIVGVVAVVGLVIMATNNNTIVAEGILPNIDENNNGALVGQATYAPCDTSSTAIINEIQTIGVQAFLANIVCSCEDTITMINNLQAAVMDEWQQAELLEGLYQIYHEECNSLDNVDFTVTLESESSGFDQEMPSFKSGKVSTNDIMDTFWESMTSNPKDEYVRTDSTQDTSKTGDCTKLAENIEQAASQQDVLNILNNAGDYCTCAQIRTEYAEYEGQWSQTWTSWMMQNCMEIRLMPRSH